MKFNIAKDVLVDVLAIVMKGMSSRSTLPILSGILLDARDGQVVFQTTDLEISIKHTAAADVVEPGRAVLPGKLFSDIVKQLPDAAVTVTSSQDQTNISCMSISYNLSSLNPTDFPYFPEVKASTTVRLPTKELASVVKKVGKAVSKDESRAILTGILFSIDETEVRFVATDSYRLAVANMVIDAPLEEPFEAIIPGRIFEDVSRLAVGAEEILIGFSDNQIIFKFGQTIFVSRKIEGTYPNYKQLIPSEHAISIQVDINALVTAIKRVSLLAQAHTPIHFMFSADEQCVVVEAKTQDIGGAREKIEASVDGEDIEIAFNHQYILDGLGAIDGDAVIELQNNLKPGIFKGTQGGDYLYLAMPVRLG